MSPVRSPLSPASSTSGTCASPDSLAATSLNSFKDDNRDFALKLYNQAKSLSQGQNIFFSPASIALALGMVLAGARGSTRDQIKAQLSSRVPDNDLNTAYAWLMRELNGKPHDYKLYTANAMYVQQDMALQQGFLQTVTGCFNSSAELRNFKTQ